MSLRQVSCVRGTGADAFTISVESVTLARAETVAITGPSGSGKSTLLEMLALVQRPSDCGSFEWELRGSEPKIQNIGNLWQRNEMRSLHGLRARRIGFVLQTGGLLPYLDVQANVELPRQIGRLPWRDSPVQHLMQTLGLNKLSKKMPHQLSVGERQRVSIARAMAHRPELLLADEPTAALDPELAEHVIDLLLDVVARAETTTVIVTHDHDRICPRVHRQVTANVYVGSAGRGAFFVDAL